ncbi:c-type cytochrome [Noviherbaspirillum agri]
MAKKTLIIATVAAAALAAATVLYFTSAGAKAERAFISPSDAALVARGKDIYAQHCASCHGASLEGQPEWRRRLANGRLPAPPHDETGHTWHHADAVLIDIVKNSLVPGRTAPDGYQTDMPAYGKTLSEEEIVAVLAYIKSNWPPDALEMQKSVTLEHAKR